MYNVCSVIMCNLYLDHYHVFPMKYILLIICSCWPINLKMQYSGQFIFAFCSWFSREIENSKVSDVIESKVIPQHTKRSDRSSTPSHISQRLKNNEVAGNESENRSFSKRSSISGSATSLSSPSESNIGSCYSVLSETSNQAPKINKGESGNVFLRRYVFTLSGKYFRKQGQLLVFFE